MASTVDNGLVNDEPTVVADLIVAKTVTALLIALCELILFRIASMQQICGSQCAAGQL